MRKINYSCIKIIITIVFLIALSIALYLRRPKDTWDPDWDKGLRSNIERNFYHHRIGRIIENWQKTNRTAEKDDKGKLNDSYNTYLIIDMDKKAIWIEENGQIRDDEYCEFPPETECKFLHYNAQGNTEYTGRTVMKMRGYNTGQMTPEQFVLLFYGTGGHINLHFNSKSWGGGYGSGKIYKPSYTFPSSAADTNNLYGSILVTGDEYTKYLDYRSEVNDTLTENENKKAWNRIEKYLYIEAERQMLKAGFKPQGILVKPGANYSAARAELRGYNNNLIRRILGGYRHVETYLKIDYLQNDIWYAKSTTDPPIPAMYRGSNDLELEFIVNSTGKIKGLQLKDLLKKGRELQQAVSLSESKWKAKLSNGMTIEFLGICDNPSVGKKWWGPDGSPIDFAPYMNAKPYGILGDSRTIYEFAWSIKNKPQDMSQTITFEGNRGSYFQTIYDRYGNQIRGDDLHAQGFSFDELRQITSLKIGFGFSDWKTVLSIQDESGEINFLDKQRVILNPPEIENGRIIIRYFVDFRVLIPEYDTDCAIIVNDGIETKTVSLNKYGVHVKDNPVTGLREHKYIIEDLILSQIEGVCFRCRPYNYVIFKNISLIPGKDQGFEIEVIEAEEE